jgi:hypothetical protein
VCQIGDVTPVQPRERFRCVVLVRRLRSERQEVATMLWTLIVLLLLFWVLGLAFNVAGGIIHVLLVIALVLFLVNLISGRRTVV